MAFWSTEAAISLKRVKIEKKLLWEAYRNSPSLFRTVPTPTPYAASPSPRLGVHTPPKTPIAIISGTALKKATNFKLARTITGSIRIKVHNKFWRKGSVGVSRDCPNCLGTPYYLRNGKSYGFHIWPVYSEGPCEQKPVKNFGEKEAWAYPGTAQIVWVPPIISVTGKATHFKFGQYIQRVHPNKSP